ncbi:DUF11 domain-containing protein [Elongatibacter sediminis]|uniref:DUF11 domain-containing protein n=1 Tax=Elongatibacter sediminis TaxID=3119006 RepID=A0AAW9RFA9_9GAMM
MKQTLIAVLLMVPALAWATESITSVSIDDTSPVAGQTINVTVNANLSNSNDDWRETKIELNTGGGAAEYSLCSNIPSPDIVNSNSSPSRVIAVTVPGGLAAGTYEVRVWGYKNTTTYSGGASGAEDDPPTCDPTGTDNPFPDAGFDAGDITVTVPEADIALSSTESIDPVVAGSGAGNLTYVITASNTSGTDVTGLTVSATVNWPVGVSVDSVTPSGSGNWSATWPGTWDIGSLANGASETLTIVFTASPSAAVGTDVISLSANVSAMDQTDTDSNNDSTAQTTSIAREVDIVVTKTESVDPVVAGSGNNNLQYTITVTNTGLSDVTGATISEVLTLPTGVTVSSLSPSTGLIGGSSPNYNWSGVDIPAGGSATLDVYLTAASNAEVATDSISDTATFTGSTGGETIVNTGDDTATEATSVAREVDIEVTKTESIDAVVAGSGDNNLTYTITVTNSGFSDVTDLVINDSTTLPANVTIDSVTPSSGSWVAPNWTVSIPAGGTETLTVVLDVPLTADEGTDVVSNTASVTGSGGGETIVNSSNDSATQATSIRWPEASFDVMKEYTSGDGGPVNVTLECSDTSGLLVYAPQQGSTTTTLTVRRFDIDPASAGTSCTVVEDVPDGFAEAARSADCDVDPTADNFDSDPYACTITNTPTRATFEVQKRYMDGNNDVPVTLNLSCNTGLPLDQSRTVFPDNEGNFGNGQFEVKFVVESYTDGELDCTVTEEPAPGYSGSYNCAGNANTDCDVGDPSGIPNDNFFEGPCVWEDITADGENGAEMKCVIRNYPDPVDVVIEKDFVLEGNPSGVDTDYDLTLYCSGEIIGGYKLDENVESPAGKPGPGCGLFKPVQESGQGIIVVQPEWCKSFSGSAPDLYEAQVIPEYPYSECYVIERVYDSAIEVDNDCFGLQVSAGQGASCTVTNTIFFEGIPTLNQYGMALLALLMLGMGFIGFRRFA